MKNKLKKTTIVLLITAAAVLAAFMFINADVLPGLNDTETLGRTLGLWSLAPTILAVALAFLTGDVILSLLAGVLLQRKRLPVDNITITVFTFFTTVILYGGIINICSFFTSAGIPGSGGFSWSTLRLLYVTGLPYDISHGLAAALCIFLIGNPMIRKIERIKIKYGIYK